MDVQAILTSISTAIGIAKTVSEINKDFDASILKLQMVELREALGDAKMALLELRDEVADRDAEIDRLTKFGDRTSELAFQDGFYLEKGEDGAPRGTAYCQYCVEGKVGFYHLRMVNKPGRPYECPHCKTEYRHAPDYRW